MHAYGSVKLMHIHIDSLNIAETTVRGLSEDPHFITLLQLSRVVRPTSSSGCLVKPSSYGLWLKYATGEMDGD